MDTEMLLRTTLTTLSLFGLPLLALAYSWGRQETLVTGAESGPRQS